MIGAVTSKNIIKKAFSVILCVVLVLSFAACSKATVGDSGSAELADIPSGYHKVITCGSVPTEEIEYTHNDHTKKAVVYLPPYYDKTKQYNILYILPGYGGSYETIFGAAGEESEFKNILDNMIISGDIEPLIAVTPGFYPEADQRLNADNFDYLVNDFRDEVSDVLITTVESRYSTYASSTDKEDLIKSREHRAFAGCSMGGAVCWDMLATKTEYFYYYAPTAAGSFEDYYEYGGVADELQHHLDDLGYTKNDFYVFGTDGTDDVTYDKMQELIERFQNEHSDLFTFTYSGKSKGNITYKVKDGGEHNYDYMFLYLYNALSSFFPA